MNKETREVIREKRKRPLRVCFIAPKAYPIFLPAVETVFGGAEVDLYYLATELAKDDAFAVSFITADYGDDKAKVVEGVRLLPTLRFAEGALRGARRLWQAMREADADVYLMKTASLGVFLTALFCRRHKRVFVCRTAHTTHCDGTFLRQHFLLGRLYRWGLRRARVVLAQNDSDVANLARTVGVTARRVANGHRLGPAAQKQREGVLWVGRSTAFKQPRLLLQLAQAFPEEVFTMICPEATDDKDYATLVHEAEAAENVRFVKRVGLHEIGAYFGRVKAFVNTSTAEGFPNTFIQACAAATPIVSLHVDPDGFLAREDCGRCAGGDFERLKAGLAELLDDETGRRCGMNGRRYAEEHHDISKIVETYKELFWQER